MINNTKFPNNSILFSAFLIFLSIIILSGVLFYIAEDNKNERSILNKQLANELRYSECASSIMKDMPNIYGYTTKAKEYRDAYVKCSDEFNSIYIPPSD